MRTSIAIYFDLENVDKKFLLSKLLETIALNMEDASMPVFAIKLACGDTANIANFREQLKNLNFEIREAPHVTVKKKNRADLILTVEAFESLYQKSPDIDLYVFITSDTDFTVIMDKLRKYGKTVWLVTKESEKDKELFTSSSDKILVIENCFVGSEKQNNETTQQIEEILKKLGFSLNESSKIKEVIESFEKNKWFDGGDFGNKIRSLIKDFSYSGKKVNSQNKLFEALKKEGIMETKKEGKVDSFRIIK